MSSRRDHHHHHDHDTHDDECSGPDDIAGAVAHVTGGLAGLSGGLLQCAGQALSEVGQALQHLGHSGCPCHERRGHHGCPCPCHRPPAPGTGNPNRPTRHPGTSTGPLTGLPLTPGQITTPLPPRTWPGTRPQLWLPYLFLRANPGDTGARPVVGPFWESPDIYILAGVPPSTAPDVPAQLGQVALAGQDNTVYAHVWNLGRTAARNVYVEFSWCNPALGIDAAGITRIGYTWTALGARGSGQAHRVVKCPESWQPTFVNGGHECLLVRAFDWPADPLTTPEWDASINRHVGQRNIHVVPSGLALTGPLQLSVGQLFGAPATVAVTRTQPSNVPWLQVRSGARGFFPAPAPATGQVSVGLAGGGTGAGQTEVTQDGMTVVLDSSDSPPPPGSAHVYRVTASQNGQTFGGYTVVIPA
jgi:hypothetical protein